jgi:hypothetical protein
MAFVSGARICYITPMRWEWHSKSRLNHLLGNISIAATFILVRYVFRMLRSCLFSSWPYPCTGLPSSDITAICPQSIQLPNSTSHTMGFMTIYIKVRPFYWRRPYSGMSRHVALVRTDVSEEGIAFFIRVTWIGELGTTLVVTSNRSTLRRNTNNNNNNNNNNIYSLFDTFVVTF